MTETKQLQNINLVLRTSGRAWKPVPTYAGLKPRATQTYEQPLVEPQLLQRKHDPLRVMMAPQLWQLGASPMSTMSFNASEAWW